MRPAIALLLIGGLLIGGCNRQSEPTPQANQSVEANAVTDAAVATPAGNATEGGVAAGNETVVEEVIGTLDRSHKGEAAPPTMFENPAGSQVSLASFKGKPVLLNLWATWCAPCVKEMPTLDAVAVRLAGKTEVLVVSQDNKAEKVDGFFQKAGFRKLQPYLDKDAALSLGMNLNLPTTILYDSQGHEVWRMLGSMDWTGQTASELIAEAG